MACATIISLSLLFKKALTPLEEALALVAELKQDLLDLDMPKFNYSKSYLPGNHLDDDQAREFFKTSESIILFGSCHNRCGCVYKGATCWQLQVCL